MFLNFEMNNVNKNSNKHEIADILTIFCSSFVIVKLYLVLFCSFSVANKLYSVQLVPFPQTQFLCMYVTYKKNKFQKYYVATIPWRHGVYFSKISNLELLQKFQTAIKM